MINLKPINIREYIFNLVSSYPFLRNGNQLDNNSKDRDIAIIEG